MSVYAVRLEFLLRNTSKYQLLLSGSGTALSYWAACNSSYHCWKPFLCRTMEQTIGICLLPSFGCDNYCSSLSANSFRVTSAGGAPWWDGVTHSIRPYYTPNPKRCFLSSLQFTVVCLWQFQSLTVFCLSTPLQFPWAPNHSVGHKPILLAICWHFNCLQNTRQNSTGVCSFLSLIFIWLSPAVGSPGLIRTFIKMNKRCFC